MTESFDRFNLLPDSLLLIIISLLDFDEAVRTSVLSKRWLSMWGKTDIIYLNEDLFVEFNESDYIQNEQRRDFFKFIEFWLRNHEESTVEKFYLTLSSTSQDALEIMKRCVVFATTHGVKELELDFSDPNWFEEDHDKPKALVELPTQVYEHQALESLQLFSCSFLETRLIKLHALKEVYFGWIELTNNAIRILLSNCKMIESLSLKKCWNSTKFDCGSNDLRLRRLVIESCNFEKHEIRINAPNLTYFKYYGKTMNCLSIQNSIAMEEADLDFALEFQDNPVADLLMGKLLRDLRHAKILAICSYILQVLPTRQGPLRTPFDLNVRHLTIKTNLHNDELLGVSFLLNSCPMLECLTLELGLGRLLNENQDYSSSSDDEEKEEKEFSFYGDKQRKWIDSVGIYQCLTTTLKVVKINNLEGLRMIFLCSTTLSSVGVFCKRLISKCRRENPSHLDFT